MLRGPENQDSSRCRRRRGGGEWGGGISLPSPLGGLGSVVSSPSGVRGGAPARKRIRVHFELEKTNVVMTNLIFFVIFSAYLESNLQDYSFDIFLIRWGPRPLRPPLSTPVANTKSVLNKIVPSDKM